PLPASSAPATKRVPSERSKRNSRRAARLEEPDPVGRPIGEEGDPDDPFVRDRAPEAAVVGRSTVVAHHEVIAGRNHDRLREIAVTARYTRRGIRVLFRHPVADHVSVDDPNTIAGAGDDPLDEGLP